MKVLVTKSLINYVNTETLQLEVILLEECERYIDEIYYHVEIHYFTFLWHSISNSSEKLADVVVPSAPSIVVPLATSNTAEPKYHIDLALVDKVEEEKKALELERQKEIDRNQSLMHELGKLVSQVKTQEEEILKQAQKSSEGQSEIAVMLDFLLIAPIYIVYVVTQFPTII